mgnify:CR=1 FL=1
MQIAVIFPVVAPPFVGKNALRPFSKIDGREAFLRCVELYTQRNQVSQRIVVVTPEDLETMQERYSAHLGFQGVTVAAGGSSWFSCVARGLEKLDGAVDTVIIHDVCCPAVSFHQLDALEATLAKHESAVAAVPVLPTQRAYADLEEGRVLEYVDMSAVSEVQSPQIFRRKALAEAYARRGASDGDGKGADGKETAFMDDAELLVNLGYTVRTFAGSRFNQRVDSDVMVRLAKELLSHLPKPASKTPLTPFGEAEW